MKFTRLKKMKLPRSYYNLLSFIGTAIAGVSFFMIGYLFIVGFFFEESNSYLGLFTYIIIPTFFVIGLLLIPLGMLIDSKRKKKAKKDYIKKGWPVIDLNNLKNRNAILIFSIGTIFFLFLTGLGSYEAFHYTESNEFCGTLCHEVMKPEYVAYQNSPHAKVACVECHVGSGASWYMRSKLSGLRQVYAVLTDDFKRPIETPLENLRPAQETCEQCHWPEKFYSRQLRNTKHYLTDSANTEWNISLQMKIGATHSAYGLSEGIHWHINPDVKIEYIPESTERTKIPWIKYTNQATGEVTVYKDNYNALEDSLIAEASPKEMDCMDCHNRPSHIYFTPSIFIDQAMATNDIANDLPYIKRLTMDLFSTSYTNTDTAMLTIENYISDYYKDEYPEVYKNRKLDIEKAISSIKAQFSLNVFPEMNVSWDNYADHIGHKTYDGCFRCHDDNHVSESGKIISKDCNLCHTIVLQGEKDNETYAALNSSLEFIHPENIDEMWKEGNCSECHRNLY